MSSNMYSTILRVLIVIATALFYFLLFWVYNSYNKFDERISKANKYKEFLYVIFSLLGCIWSIFVYYEYKDIFAGMLRSIPNDFLFRLIGVRPYVNFLFLVITIFSTNLLLGLFMEGIKALVDRFLVSRYVYSREGIFTTILNFFTFKFYDFENAEPTLQNKWLIFRRALKVFIRVFTIYTIAIGLLPAILSMAMLDNLGLANDIINSVFLIPFVVLLFLSDVYNFLSGITKENQREDFAFDDTNIKKLSSYQALANQFKYTFPQHFSTELVYKPNEVIYFNAEQKDDIDLRSRIDNPNVLQIVNKIKEKVRLNPNTAVNRNLIKMISDLYQGKNVAVNSSIFSDMSDYLFNYMENVISNGKSVLIICKDQNNCEYIKEFIQNQNYEKLSHLKNKSIWNIKTGADNFDGTTVDVLIVTPQMLTKDSLLDHVGDFVKNLELVVMFDSQDIMSNNTFLPMLIGWKLNYRTEGRNLQYVFFLEQCLVTITDSLKHAFQTNDIELINDVREARGEVYIDLWKSEAPLRMQDEWLTDGARNYYGNLITLGAFGISTGGIKNVYVATDTNHGYSEFLNNIVSDGESFPNYHRIVERTKVGKLDRPIQRQSFVVTDDYMNNIPLMLKLSSRLWATESTLIHLVSKPYLLRDFFYSRGENLKNLKYNYQLTPSIDYSQQNIIYNFLCEAHYKEVPEEEVLMKVGRALFPENSEVSAQEVLLECLKRVLNRNDLDVTYVYDYFTFKKHTTFDGTEYKDSYSVRFDNDTLYNDIIKDIQNVKLDLTNIPEDLELDLLTVQIPQNYIEGQIIVYDGRNYQIQKIDMNNGIIRATSIPFVEAVPDYVQDKHFRFNFDYLKIVRYKANEIIDSEKKDFIDRSQITIFTVPATIEVKGYTALHSDNYFGKEDKYFPLNEEIVREDNYNECMLLSYNVKGLTETELNSMSTTLAILLQEIFKTLFPKIYQYISVIPIVEKEAYELDEKIGLDLSRIYASCDFFDVKNITEQDYNLNVLIVEDSLIDVGAVEALSTDINLVHNILSEYLEWFLNEAENSPNPFLYYGQESLPAFLDLENVKKLADIYKEKKAPLEMREQIRLQSDLFCSFCGNPIDSVELYTYDDGRICCQNCYESRITDQQELVKIYHDMRQYLYDNFKIKEEDLPKNVSVNFKSADSIRRKLGTQADPYSRVLGFANRMTNELWVETGAPEMNIRSVIAHEMTHIWQYKNLDMDNEKLNLPLVEGLAAFVETEYYKYLGYEETYKKKQLELLNRDDEYGIGYKLVLELVDKGESPNPFDWYVKTFGK